MWWLNAGVAPIYKEYKLAVQLWSQGDQAVIRVPVEVTKWLPGDSVVDESLYIPANLRAGKYRLRIGILDLETGKPAIRLPIDGRQPDGWYDMGSIEVER
jgi:hypothetical protein